MIRIATPRELRPTPKERPVGLTTKEGLDQFTDSLFREIPEESRCPHLKRDKISPYCARELMDGEEITDGRRVICSTSSLQFYCFDKERYSLCIWYNDEPF